MSSLLKGGRLAATRREVVNFISSLNDDKRIAHATVLTNEAHVIALTKAKAIDLNDARKLLHALRQLEHHVPLREGVEDIHLLVEEYVIKHTERDVGEQLHLAKSRNDQVATAIRMVLRNELLEISDQLLLLGNELLQVANKHLKSVFPGYTHLQPAQPITFAHYLSAIADSFLRDAERLNQAYRRVNVSPMGAGALAGSSLRLDRALEAELLGFDGIITNTLDAVGSRDFALDALSALTITALDISRVTQDIIFYSSADVEILEIPDEFTSTSSIMPQKKNPDPLELIRAKSATVFADFTAVATILHGLPSGYNLDFQEITPSVWHASDTLKSCLGILTQLVPGLKPKETITQRPHLQYTASTEIANILVREEKFPFRSAHRAVGRIVKMALEQNKRLSQLTATEWERELGKRLSKRTVTSIEEALDLKKHIWRYSTKGSPNPKETARMVQSKIRKVRLLSKINARSHATLNRSLKKLRSAQERSRVN